MRRSDISNWTPPVDITPPKHPKPIILVVLALAAVVLFGSLNCFYTVDVKKQAVATTLDNANTDASIERVEKVDVYHHFEVGYHSDAVEPIPEENSETTADNNTMNEDYCEPLLSIKELIVKALRIMFPAWIGAQAVRRSRLMLPEPKKS